MEEQALLDAFSVGDEGQIKELTPLYSLLDTRKLFSHVKSEHLPLLIELGVKPGVKPGYPLTRETINCIFRKHPTFSHTLFSLELDLNFLDKEGISPLMSAIMSVHSNTAGTVALLLSYGVNPNFTENKTPLHYAVMHDSGSRYLPKKLEIIRLLLEGGADPNIADKNGKLPLSFADELEVVKLLFPVTKDKNHVDNEGNSFLMRGVPENVALYYIAQGVDVQIKSGGYFTAAFYHYQNPNVMIALLDAGATIDAWIVERTRLGLYHPDAEYREKSSTILRLIEGRGKIP